MHTSANVGSNSHIRLRESFLKWELNLRNNVYVFSPDKYTSGSYNAPTWRKHNPRAKTFSKTTIQVTDRIFYNSVSSVKVTRPSPPRKRKSALKT